MSGGAWEYNYIVFHVVADNLLAGQCVRHDKPEITATSHEARVRLGKLVELVAVALHDIEWVDSSDMSPEDELPAIQKVFDFLKDSK